MMGKWVKILVIYVCTFSLFLTSCNILSTGEVSSMDKLNRDTEVIFDALANKDTESLKSVFSETAYKQSEDLDASIEMLFSFFEGDIEKYEFDEFPASDERNRGLKRQIQYRRGCDIYTNKYHYEMLLIYYSEDDFEPENVGLYHLKIFKNGTECGSWQEDLVPGILILE